MSLHDSLIEPLPEDVEALLAQARRTSESFPTVHANVRARLETSIPAAWPVAARPKSGPVLRSVGRRVLAPLAAFGLGTGAGAVFQAKRMASPAVAAVATLPAPISAPPAPVPVSPPMPAPPPAPLPAPVVRPPVAPKPAVAPPHAAPRAVSDVELAQEEALLERARAALARGQAAAALEALDLHARRFAAGRLAEERAALRVQALAQAGEQEQAQAAASAFHHRYPESLLTGAVDSSVDTIP